MSTWEFYALFTDKWKTPDVKIGNQILDFSSLKILLHFPSHVIIAFLPSLLTFLVMSLTGFMSPLQSVVTGFICGSTIGIALESYQIWWFYIDLKNYTGILQCILDMISYILGASILWLFLI